jgi:hypothetical protein
MARTSLVENDDFPLISNIVLKTLQNVWFFLQYVGFLEHNFKLTEKSPGLANRYLLSFFSSVKIFMSETSRKRFVQ